MDKQKESKVRGNKKTLASCVFNHSNEYNRTLYFHTGTQKTGSSSLQAYLATNKTKLSESGVSYELLDNIDYLTSLTGNGQYLFTALYQRNLPDSQLDELLELYLAGKSKAICSSEDFSWYRPQEWQQIKDSCKRLKVDIKFVTFVRNIGSFYFSAYGQLIKNHGLRISFDEFCKENQYRNVIDSLKCLIEVFGKESMTVIHYESAINHIDVAFMDATGIVNDNYDISPIKRIINRSLTKYELEILTRINDVTGQQYGHDLSRYLMNMLPHLKTEKVISPEVVEILKERHIKDAGWLNHVFLNDKDLIKINDDELDDNRQNSLSIVDQQAIDRKVNDWCVSKLQSAQDSSIEYITDRLRKIDWGKAGNLQVPVDFDPIAYLLVNPDILKAGVPPYEHFIASGQNENRKWKWKS